MEHRLLRIPLIPLIVLGLGVRGFTKAIVFVYFGIAVGIA
jgi:hypothetical protein